MARTDLVTFLPEHLNRLPERLNCYACSVGAAKGWKLPDAFLKDIWKLPDASLKNILSQKSLGHLCAINFLKMVRLRVSPASVSID
eukprot:4958656-Pleurochrysis_carterae.AAC.2